MKSTLLQRFVKPLKDVLHTMYVIMPEILKKVIW